jgi:hypothetical protein
MLSRIRLADRRGLLTGSLSSVQEYALKMLMLSEDTGAARAMEQLHGPAPDDPDAFEEDWESDEGISWQMPSETPPNVEEILARLGGGLVIGDGDLSGPT